MYVYRVYDYYSLSEAKAKLAILPKVNTPLTAKRNKVISVLPALGTGFDVGVAVGFNVGVALVVAVGCGVRGKVGVEVLVGIREVGDGEQVTVAPGVVVASQIGPNVWAETGFMPKTIKKEKNKIPKIFLGILNLFCVFTPPVSSMCYDEINTW